MDIEDFGKTEFKHNTKESNMIPDKMPSEMTKEEVEKYFPKRGLHKPQVGDFLYTSGMSHTEFLRAVDAFKEQGAVVANCVFDKTLNTLFWATNGLHHINYRWYYQFQGRDLTPTVGHSCLSENFDFAYYSKMETFTGDFINHGQECISENQMLQWAVLEGRVLYNPHTERLVWAKKWKDEPVPDEAKDIEDGLVEPGLDFISGLHALTKQKIVQLSGVKINDQS